MVRSKQFVKKSGFSYIEFIFSLFIFINIFVLSQQIIYNIYKVKENVENNKIMSFEVLALRIESHFKEVKDYEIGENYLLYYYRNSRYLYQVEENALTYSLNNNTYVLIEGIKEIFFRKENYLLEIIIIDLADYSYELQIIIYDK